jgi:hypothetical protein
MPLYERNSEMRRTASDFLRRVARLEKKAATSRYEV